jgi:hypothetical protein
MSHHGYPGIYGLVAQAERGTEAPRSVSTLQAAGTFLEPFRIPGRPMIEDFPQVLRPPRKPRFPPGAAFAFLLSTRAVCRHRLLTGPKPMMSRTWIAILIGSTIGGFVPALWGGEMLSVAGVLWSGIGALAGLWIANRT